MKALKIIGIIVGALIAIFLIGALLIPSEYNVAESRTINAPAEVIYTYTGDFKNWHEWGPWQEQDPTMQYEYSDNTSQVGGWYTWTSEEMGEGRMEITAQEPNALTTSTLEFDGEAPAYTSIKLEPAGDNQTTVTWTMEGKMPYPMTWMTLMMPSMIKPFYQRGLEKLDSISVARYAEVQAEQAAAAAAADSSATEGGIEGF